MADEGCYGMKKGVWQVKIIYGISKTLMETDSLDEHASC